MNTIYPNQENCTAEELERYIRLAKNVTEKNRLLSIRMIWRGMSVCDVADTLVLSDVIVYQWIHRFNAKGLDGLLSRYKGGRPRLISKDAFKQILNVFEEPQKAGQVHWTAKKFHAYLKEELGVTCSYQTVLNHLKENGYKLKYGRSWPEAPEGNEAKREEFKSRILGLLSESNADVWYMDEAGFDGDPRPRRGWSKRGERKKIYRTQKHLRINVSGMCCPRSGEFFALEFPYGDRATFQAFLDTANRDIKLEREKNYIVLDNASWHKTKSINWGKLEPIFLPPFSPDLNPIERIWGYLKNTFFHSFCAKNYDELIEHLDIALCSLFDSKETVSSITKKVET